MTDDPDQHFRPSPHAFRDCPCSTRWLSLASPGPGAYRNRPTGGDPLTTEADVQRVAAADGLRPGRVIATCVPSPEHLPHQWIAPPIASRQRWHVHVDVLGHQVHVEDVRSAEGRPGGYHWCRLVYVDGRVAQVLYRLWVPIFGGNRGDDSRAVRCLLDDRHQLRISPGTPMELALEEVPAPGQSYDERPWPTHADEAPQASGGRRGRGAIDHVFETVTWYDLEELLEGLGATLGEVRRTGTGALFAAAFRGNGFEIRACVDIAPSAPLREWELSALCLESAPVPPGDASVRPFMEWPQLTVRQALSEWRLTTVIQVRAMPRRELRALLAAWLEVVSAFGEATGFDMHRDR
ncbi:hypothetical protein TBR22_A52030 [Luteitalea sp. TBR-22]|uniref:hypothetical protein n=1 Tax=Luteitalea sp. TBR-22 TaxID=2802971 RepID=UPI001AF3F47F|nr:hypothetical protein [Luteitalea sp. TBR-22]BCS35967.1 hypothetical protein TBR22_A52030 [Luteitalea sp. TBR-22]